MKYFDVFTNPNDKELVNFLSKYYLYEDGADDVFENDGNVYYLKYADKNALSAWVCVSERNNAEEQMYFDDAYDAILFIAESISSYNAEEEAYCEAIDPAFEKDRSNAKRRKATVKAARKRRLKIENTLCDPDNNIPTGKFGTHNPYHDDNGCRWKKFHKSITTERTESKAKDAFNDYATE